MCVVCGKSWEIDAREAGQIVSALEAQRGFAVDLSHLAMVESGYQPTVRSRADPCGAATDEPVGICGLARWHEAKMT